MKVRVVDRHDGEGQFPTFDAGEFVHDLQPCVESAHWLSCTINGFSTYVPDAYVENTTLNRRYNPTELVADKDEILEVAVIVYEWLQACNGQGVYGWIPAEKVLSVS